VSETYWLSVTNAALGAVVLICAFVVVAVVVREVTVRMRRRAKMSAELDGDMRRLVEEFGDRAFLDPELGITMADGGEKIDPKDPK
jgi:flagellar biosynthesis/type III secretory pathway M-ring protein FliF/YscJ